MAPSPREAVGGHWPRMNERLRLTRQAVVAGWTAYVIICIIVLPSLLLLLITQYPCLRDKSPVSKRIVSDASCHGADGLLFGQEMRCVVLHCVVLQTAGGNPGLCTLRDNIRFVRVVALLLIYARVPAFRPKHKPACIRGCREMLGSAEPTSHESAGLQKLQGCPKFCRSMSRWPGRASSCSFNKP